MAVVFQANGDITLRYENERETLGMGGPFTGELFVNEMRMEGLYVVDNPKLSADKRHLILAKYNIEGKGRKDVNFTIVILCLSDFFAYESNLKLNLLHIESMRENQIVFYESTHNQFENRKRIIEFSIENFSPFRILDTSK